MVHWEINKLMYCFLLFAFLVPASNLFSESLQRLKALTFPQKVTLLTCFTLSTNIRSILSSFQPALN